jgi:hypothetical protein
LMRIPPIIKHCPALQKYSLLKYKADEPPKRTVLGGRISTKVGTCPCNETFQ